MTTVKSLVVENFRKFSRFEIAFDEQRSLIVGDNESGKSSLLLALDLVLSGSRSRVESIGIDSLFNDSCITEFLAGPREYHKLPELVVEAWLSPQPTENLNGKINSKDLLADGVRLQCIPNEDWSADIRQLLSDNEQNFPFEYYKVEFKTFRGDHFSPQSRPLRHLLLDNTRIDSEYAAREYIRSVFESHTDPKERSRLENLYRKSKGDFGQLHLAAIKKEDEETRFALRSSTRANLATDLSITEKNIPLEARGRGRQCFVKTDFALSRKAAKSGLELLLIEEPENHLSQTHMKLLIERIAAATKSQLLIATHSSLVCSRLDLRKAALLSPGDQTSAVSLASLTEETAAFFMKAPDNNILAFVTARRVILVEGDAEFILMGAFYKKSTAGRTTEDDGVHVMSVGGTAFKRYLELAKLLSIRTAVIRDNDGDHEQNCVKNYEDFGAPNISIFADKDPARRTFEICVYEDNKVACEEVLSTNRRTLDVQTYMLKNKTDAAFELLRRKGEALNVPTFIAEAIAWIRN